MSKKSFLFVCTANKFRSKFEEAIAKKFFGKKIYSDSCGINEKTKYGSISPKKLREESNKLFNLSDDVFIKKSKRIDLELVKNNDYIIYQQNSHKKFLEENYSAYKNKFIDLREYFLGKPSRIPDLAFISDIKKYRTVLKLIYFATKKLIKDKIYE